MRPPVRRALHAMHAWSGALLAVMLFVVCLSGSWTVLKDELRYWEARSERVAGADRAVDLDRLLARAAALGMDVRNATMALPPDRHSPLRITVGSGPREPRGNAPARSASGGRDGAPPQASTVSAAPEATVAAPAPRTVLLDPASGALLTPYDGRMADIVSTLHKQLYLGFPGRVLVSLSGVALTVLIVGGLLLHPRRFKDTITLRRGRGWPLLALDAHRVLGVWLLPLLLVLAVSGLFCGWGALGTITLNRVADPAAPQRIMGELTARFAPVPAAGEAAAMPSLNALLTGLAGQRPDFVPHSLALQHWGDAHASVTLAGTHRGQLSTPVFEQYRLSVRDPGTWVARSSAGRGVWLAAFAAIQPLHFGHYGGAWVRVLYALGGLGGAVLCASGLLLWLHRRRQRGVAGRGDSLLQAGAVGVCGGLTLACALLLPLTAVLPEAGRAAAQAVAFWSLWAFTAVGAAWASLRGHGRTALSSGAAMAAGACLLAACVDTVVSLRTAVPPAHFTNLMLAASAIALWRLAVSCSRSVRDV